MVPVCGFVVTEITKVPYPCFPLRLLERETAFNYLFVQSALTKWVSSNGITAECVCSPHCWGPNNLAEKCWVYTKLGYSSLLLILSMDLLEAGPVPIQLVRLVKPQVLPQIPGVRCSEAKSRFREAVALHILENSGACYKPAAFPERGLVTLGSYSSQYWRERAIGSCSCHFSGADLVLVGAHQNFPFLPNTCTPCKPGAAPLKTTGSQFQFVCCVPYSWRLPQLSRTGFSMKASRKPNSTSQDAQQAGCLEELLLLTAWISRSFRQPCMRVTRSAERVFAPHAYQKSPVKQCLLLSSGIWYHFLKAGWVVQQTPARLLFDWIGALQRRVSSLRVLFSP